MTTEISSSNPTHSSSTDSTSTENHQSVSLPVFLTTSSSSLKPLRERNRTNLKRRIKLSRSQVLSNDFENDDTLSHVTNNIHKATPSLVASIPTSSTTIAGSSSQPTPSTPNPVRSESYSKTLSPTTPSPIHSTVTCSQVWERLASHEEQQNPASPTANGIPNTASPSTSNSTSFPTHISFSYERSDDEDDDTANIINDDKNDFQYVPLSSQSKLVQCQFITFARQQQFLLENNSNYDDSDDDDDDDDDKDNDDDDDDNDDDDENANGDYYPVTENGCTNDQQNAEQENRTCKKRKRSVSTVGSLDGITPIPLTTADTTADGSSVAKPPRTKKPKVKDPNANFQRLNMRKKNFSHAKKHQFSRNKRNAFYRRMRNGAANR